MATTPQSTLPPNKIFATGNLLQLQAEYKHPHIHRVTLNCIFSVKFQSTTNSFILKTQNFVLNLSSSVWFSLPRPFRRYIFL